MSNFETFETDFGDNTFVPATLEFDPIMGKYERPLESVTDDGDKKAYPTVFKQPDQFPGPVSVDETL